MTQLSASDRKAIREAEKQIREEEVASGEVIRAIMVSAQGRAYLWCILESAQCFATTFTDNPVRSAYLEGRRSLGLEILDGIQRWCPEQFILAMREANDRRTIDAARSRSDDSAPDGPEHEPEYVHDGFDAEGYPTFKPRQRQTNGRAEAE